MGLGIVLNALRRRSRTWEERTFEKINVNAFDTQPGSGIEYQIHGIGIIQSKHI